MDHDLFQIIRWLKNLYFSHVTGVSSLAFSIAVLKKLPSLRSFLMYNTDKLQFFSCLFCRIISILPSLNMVEHSIRCNKINETFTNICVVNIKKKVNFQKKGISEMNFYEEVREK